ncbi:hypothetical protein [Hydrogenimonas sp.]|uniref:type II secretion system protein GspM n=1 Tax=Hydrogenimonas sp. TaxID=2231112 RepID=UPI00260274D1|nr:hypothetical protein [Hydrogenimonas sp.]
MSLLRDTENQFESFSPIKRLAVTVGAAVMIVAMGWYLWIDPLNEEIEASSIRCDQIQQQIARVNLRRISTKLEQVKRERLKLQEDLREAEAAKRYLQSRARQLDFIWFEQKSFLDMLDRVLKRSVDLGLRIDLIESVEINGEVMPLIEKKKAVHIEGEGRFADIVKLIQFIESFNALLKVEHMKIWLAETGETLFRIDLLSYGAKL